MWEKKTVKRKIKILLLSLGVLFIGMTGVQAAENTVVSISSHSGNAGDAVIEAITITPDSGFGAGQFDIKFDPAKLEYSGYTMGDALDEHEKASGGLLDVNKNKAGDGQLTISYISTEDVKEGGTLLNLKFKLKESGETTVNLAVPELVKNDGTPVAVTVDKSETANGEEQNAVSGETQNRTETAAVDTIKKGETTTLLNKETFQGLDETKPITWTSSDPGIATVDETGTLKTTGNGKVTVTATQGDKTVTYEMDVQGEATRISDARNQTILILLAVTGAAVIALGGLMFFKIRKRKAGSVG